MSIVVRNLSDQLVELVRDRILSGEVPADLPIRQDALAAELGVSKIPLREAMARLERDGLLRAQANRGYFVRALTAEEAEEVYALRLKLEPEAVVRAAALADDADRQAAAGALAALEAAMEGNGAGVGALNRAFHLALIRPSGQQLTTAFLERLHILSERYVRMHLEPHGRDARARDEHRHLLDAWLAREPEALATLVGGHIRETLHDLRRQLASG